jgi:hypothetical protein
MSDEEKAALRPASALEIQESRLSLSAAQAGSMNW